MHAAAAKAPQACEIMRTQVHSILDTLHTYTYIAFRTLKYTQASVSGLYFAA